LAEPSSGQNQQKCHLPLSAARLCPHEAICGAVLDCQPGFKADVGLLPLPQEPLGGWHMFLTPTLRTKKASRS